MRRAHARIICREVPGVPRDQQQPMHLRGRPDQRVRKRDPPPHGDQAAADRMILLSET